MDYDTTTFAQRLVKYLLEGLAVAVVAYYLPSRKLNLQEIGLVALTAAATFAVLDQFAPGVSPGARLGSGFGIGANLVGYSGLGVPMM